MADWIEALGHLLQTQPAAVLVTVASIKGSTPREAGARMLVAGQLSWGTIGGGNLEFQAMDIARKLLTDVQQSHVQRFTLGAGLGQCCGGVVTLMFERFEKGCVALQQLQTMQATQEAFIQLISLDDQKQRYLVSESRAMNTSGECLSMSVLKQARDYLRNHQSAAVIGMNSDEQSARYLFDPIFDNRFDIMIFGAGHVGQAVVKILADQACRIHWVDTRDQQFPATCAANVNMICTDTPESEIEQAPAHSFFLVMTHDHQLDQRLCEAILQRDDYDYFGLIGSLTKRKKFEHRLMARGISAQALSRMRCPIGVDGINSKQPAAIALSVSAQIIQIQQQLAQQQNNSLQQVVN